MKIVSTIYRFKQTCLNIKILARRLSTSISVASLNFISSGLLLDTLYMTCSNLCLIKDSIKSSGELYSTALIDAFDLAVELVYLTAEMKEPAQLDVSKYVFIFNSLIT